MGCFWKNLKALLLRSVEDTLDQIASERWQKYKATFLSPSQNRSPALPQTQIENDPVDKVRPFLCLSEKMDFLSFHCEWKCNISVCNFNFTADWHLQRQRILIKLQKHLIQWLADGKRGCSNSIFLIMLTKHGMCFSNTPTLFHLQFKSDD